MAYPSIKNDPHYGVARVVKWTAAFLVVVWIIFAALAIGWSAGVATFASAGTAAVWGWLQAEWRERPGIEDDDRGY